MTESETVARNNATLYGSKATFYLSPRDGIENYHAGQGRVHDLVARVALLNVSLSF